MQSIKNVLFANIVCAIFIAKAKAEFEVPAFRGQPQSTYQQWDMFTTSTGVNFPDVASENPNGIATLQELTGGAFITSGGNFYSFAIPTSFIVDLPDFDLGAQASTRVVIQIRTQGSTVDLDSVLFNGVPANSAVLLYEEPLGGFGGFLRDWKFEWNEVSGNMASNAILFDAEESSMSLDRLAVDTLAETSPSPVLLTARVLHFGFGGAGQPPFHGLDNQKLFVTASDQLTPLTLENIVSSSLGINGIAMDFLNLTEVDDLQWSFQVSPQGVFDLQQFPFESWENAPQPTSVTLYPGEGDNGSDRVVFQWPNQSIVDRYLRIIVSADGDELQELFIGHLGGKTIENAGDTFTVSFADISPIRTAIGQSVNAGSRLDINKDGLVAFSDISAMRGNVGKQLSRLVVPVQD